MARFLSLLALFLGIYFNNVFAADAYSIERMEMRAQLMPRRFTTLSSEMGAKINRITVKEGDYFKVGQSLILFDCTLQLAQLDKAKAQLVAAENVYNGNRKMAELNAVGQVELKNSEAEVMKAKAEVAFLRATVDKCTVIAPFGGRVTEQKAREQQYVQPGQALLDILDDSALELEFIVPSKYLAWMKVGHRFQVKIDETSKAYPAKIVRVSAKVDPVSQTVKAVAVVDGRFQELVAGMSGNVLISAEKGH